MHRLENQFNTLCREMDDFMNDDLNTAKVLANMFQLVNHINSFRSGELEKTTLSAETLSYVQTQFKTYLEDVLGLRDDSQKDSDKTQRYYESAYRISDAKPRLKKTIRPRTGFVNSCWKSAFHSKMKKTDASALVWNKFSVLHTIMSF